MEGERKINVDTKKCAIYCWKSTWMCNLKRRSNVVNLVFVGKRRGPSSARSLNCCSTFTLIVYVKLLCYMIIGNCNYTIICIFIPTWTGQKKSGS